MGPGPKPGRSVKTRLPDLYFNHPQGNTAYML